MQTVQVVLDADLLQEADLAARKHNINRSALIRDALRGHLKRMHILQAGPGKKAARSHHRSDSRIPWIDCLT